MLVKTIVKVYSKKENENIKFSKAIIGGKFIPVEIKGVDDDETYTIKIVGGGTFPLIEGVYSFDCSDMWVDKRPEYIEKKIVRCKNVNNITFIKTLNKTE